MATREQIVDSIKAGAGQRAVASEVETAVYQSIADLRDMITALMNQVETLSNSVEAASATQNSVDNLRAACQLMASKVDATATPVTSFVSTFNNNI